MAEKEERILHIVQKLDGRFVGENRISRKEAIEKISHALCTQVHGGCETCEQVAGGNENYCNDYRTYAEAALNALLEDKK